MVRSTDTRPTPTATARAATAKRAETRKRVLATTIETVAEMGITGASATTIAERSGLSWGVIQYHFGDRLGLFLAAFEDAIDGFERRQRDAAAGATGPVAERVEHLLAQAWLQMTSAGYRGLLEIQLLLAREPAVAAQYHAGTRRASRAARDAWRSTFPDIDRARVDRVHEVALAALRGLAVSHALGTPASGSVQARHDLADATLLAIEA